MSKRVTIWLLLVLVAWFQPALAWAAPAQSGPAQPEVIRLAQNPELEAFSTSLQPQAIGLGGLKVEPWFWMLSIPVPGLGQLLMGDPTRAAFFFLAPLVTAWIFFFAWQSASNATYTFDIGSPKYPTPGGEFATLSPGGAGGGGGIILLLYGLPVLPILALLTWNIIDAYSMNQQLAAGPGESPALEAEHRREMLLTLLKVAEENQLRPAGAGIGLGHRLASF
ncbi:MAG: hypothetical protein ACAI44_11580 [Candidatus Sericytochromatia bacterium]